MVTRDGARWRVAAAVADHHRPAPHLVAAAAVSGLAAGAMVPSLVVEVATGGDAAVPLAASAVAMGAFAAVVGRFFRFPDRVPLATRYEVLVVTALASIAATGLPFLLAGTFEGIDDVVVDATAAVSTSAITLLDVEDTSQGLLLWRSTAQWLGGLGVLVLTVHILPSLGVGGLDSGGGVATRSARRLSPRRGGNLTRLGTLYALLTVLAGAGFLATGVDPFDAVAHALTIASTGGFSTREGSFGALGTPTAEWVAIVVMFLAGCSLPLVYRTVRRRQGALLRSYEFGAYVAVVMVGTGLLWVSHPRGLEGVARIREALFTATSAASTTGAWSVAPSTWGEGGQVLLVGLMLVGGMGASLTGGLKVVRVLALLGQTRRELHRQLHDHLVQPVRLGRSTVSDAVLARIVGDVALTMLMIGVGMVLLAAAGAGIVGAGAAAVTSISLGGPVLAPDGPAGHFAVVDGFGRVVMAVLMFLGRTAVLPVLALVVTVSSPMGRMARRHSRRLRAPGTRR